MSSAADSVVIKNIYYMMAYAFKALNVDGYANLKTEEFDNIADLLAAILVIGMSQQRKRGLEKEYMEFDEDLHGVRGHIDMRGTARLRMAQRNEIACVFDEFSADTYKNRILKTCARILLSSHDLDIERSRGLKRCLMTMSEVGEVEPVRIEWGRLQYHRNVGGYQLLMNVCYMIVNDLLLSSESGNVKLADFLSKRKLSALYEKFVLEYYIREHKELVAKAEEIPRGSSSDAPSFLPHLCTDVTLKSREYNNRVLIIDTKCYGEILKVHHKKKILSASHLNQIQSYVMHAAYDADLDVSGMLLYALTDSEKAMRESWNEMGHSWHCWTLNLNQDFSGISHDLDEIAELIS